jgi:hypothetical protein
MGLRSQVSPIRNESIHVLDVRSRLLSRPKQDGKTVIAVYDVVSLAIEQIYRPPTCPPQVTGLANNSAVGYFFHRRLALTS